MLKLDSIKKMFPDGTLALNNVSFEIQQGDFIVVGGANGSGKSVLMSIIAELEEPTEGRIVYDESVEGGVGLVFQDADAQILGETPEEDIAFGLKQWGLKKAERAEKVEAALVQSGLYERRYAPARLLSGGEKRRLAVAGILALDCSLIIFDEPFANLDWPGVRQVCQTLKQLKDAGKTIVVLTHELEKVLALANRFLVLHKGSLVFDGTPADGLQQNLSCWGIRPPLVSYANLESLVWL